MLEYIRSPLFYGFLLAPLAGGCATPATNTAHPQVQVPEGQSQVETKRLLLIAKTYEQQGHSQRAAKAYNRIVADYPTSNDVPFAKERLVAISEGAPAPGVTPLEIRALPAETMLAKAAQKSSAHESEFDTVTTPSDINDLVAQTALLARPEAKTVLDAEPVEVTFSDVSEEQSEDQTTEVALTENEFVEAEIEESESTDLEDIPAFPEIPTEVAESETKAASVRDSARPLVVANEDATDPAFAAMAPPASVSPTEEVAASEETTTFEEAVETEEVVEATPVKPEVVAEVAEPPQDLFVADAEVANTEAIQEMKVPDFESWSASGWRNSSETTAEPHEVVQDAFLPPAEQTIVTSPVIKPQEVADEEVADVGWVETADQQVPELTGEMSESEQLALLAFEVGTQSDANQETVDSLLALLQHKDETVRLNSAEALFNLGKANERAFEVVEEAMNSENEDTRFVATYSLSSIYSQDPSRGLNLMLTHLATNTVTVQRQLALMLGEYSEQSATLIPILQRVSQNHPDRDVCEAAKLSIECLQTP